MATDRELAKVYFTKLEMARVKEATLGTGESVSGFIRRTVLNNLGPVPDTGIAKDAPKIQRQLAEFRKPVPPVATIPGKAAYDPEDRLPDFVADQPAEESRGSGTDQDVRRYEELPVGGRGAARGERVNARAKPSRVSSRMARTERTAKRITKCDQAVGPGLYCPKCDRRH